MKYKKMSLLKEHEYEIQKKLNDINEDINEIEIH
jgi:hypothetical protein